MTIDRAREILQEEADGLSDQDIIHVIQSVGIICEELLNIIVSENK